MIIYKTIKTPAGYYVYDRGSHSILKIDKGSYDVLYECENKESTQKDSIFAEVIKKYNNSGYLLENTVETIEHPDTKNLGYYCNNKIQQLTLQVTQRCNLRCSYCVYGGDYLNRKHSNQDMDIELAKKAINYLVEHSDHSREVILAFYGGEPLMRFGFIKQCVLYIESLMNPTFISYTLTTNGTLLTCEMVEFFSKYDFHIMISIDGSKEEHNANRCFSDGTGSFDCIMKNLNIIHEFKTDFLKNIHINCVLNPKQNYDNVKNFFGTDSIVQGVSVIMNVVSAENRKSQVEFATEFWYARLYEELLLNIYLLRKCKSSELPESVLLRAKSLNKEYNRLRDIKKLGKCVHHNGPCLPGVRRLFVNVNGDFFPCERVPENADVFKIGNIGVGINVAKAQQILNVGKLTENQCKNCWALLQCSVCAQKAYDESDKDKLSAQKKLQHCSDSKISAYNVLKKICILKEFGYKFGEEQSGEE